MVPQFAHRLRIQKRKARLAGRPLTAQETSGMARGYASTATQRLVAGKGIELQEKGLTQAREMQSERLAQQKMIFEKEFGLKGEQFERMYGEEGLYPGKWAAERELTKTGQAITKYGITTTQATAREGFKSQEAIAASTRGHQARMQRKKVWQPSCIIITACTSPDSYDVNIAREYRDNILSIETLAGYYALCEVVVPWIHKSGLFKAIIKNCLVDRMIDYFECALNYKKKTDFMTSEIITKGFLSICDLISKHINQKHWLMLHR